MFGYVKACKGEMKVKEYELYSAAYCGLCRAMGKCTGQCSRLTLNYDFVFLYLVRCALEGEMPTVSRHRCIVHPLRRRPMIDISNAMRYSARASAGLCAFKLEDDIHDTKGAKRLLYLTALPLFSHFKKRASLPQLEESVKARLRELDTAEQERCASLDLPAEIFGKLLGEVFSHGLEGSSRTLAYEIGFHTGKFIYAADAADDYESDLKSRSYNPIAEIYGENFGENEKKGIQSALCCELKRLESAIDLVDFSACPEIGEIVYNIIFLGMPEQMSKALYHNNSERTEQKND